MESRSRSSPRARIAASRTSPSGSRRSPRIDEAVEGRLTHLGLGVPEQRPDLGRGLPGPEAPEKAGCFGPGGGLSMLEKPLDLRDQPPGPHANEGGTHLFPDLSVFVVEEGEDAPRRASRVEFPQGHEGRGPHDGPRVVQEPDQPVRGTVQPGRSDFLTEPGELVLPRAAAERGKDQGLEILRPQMGVPSDPVRRRARLQEGRRPRRVVARRQALFESRQRRLQPRRERPAEVHEPDQELRPLGDLGVGVGRRVPELGDRVPAQGLEGALRLVTFLDAVGAELVDEVARPAGRPVLKARKPREDDPECRLHGLPAKYNSSAAVRGGGGRFPERRRRGRRGARLQCDPPLRGILCVAKELRA